jgi:hypothetical protein
MMASFFFSLLPSSGTGLFKKIKEDPAVNR